MRAVVTGGAGSIGSKLSKYLINKYETVVALDNNTNALIELNRKKQSIPTANIDIRDEKNLKKFLKQNDHVYHTAALKHVPNSETFPSITYKTNINGTENVIHAAKYNEIEKLINISTNKSVEPTNVMGASKLIGERIVSSSDYCNVRFGNVALSEGAVIPYFLEKAEKGEKIPVTCPEMTRFFIYKDKAVELIHKANQLSEGNETFIMKMPAFKIGHIAEYFEEEYGVERKVIGPRTGEKKHEEIMTSYEAKSCIETEDFFVLKKNQKVKESKRPKRTSEEFVASKEKCHKFLKDILNT